MKIKRKISLILSLILTFFLTTNYGQQISANADTTGKPELTVTSSDSDNYVHLNWTPPDKDKYYSYRLFSKESSEPIFQSIPSKAKVKVLNIYPEVGNNLKTWIDTPALELSKSEEKYDTTLDIYVHNDNETKSHKETLRYNYIKDENGNFITNGRGLVMPNPKNSNEPYKDGNGYVFVKDSNGNEEKGLISVDEVPISKFDDDLSKGINDLYNENGEYKYDVIYQGGFDSNNKKKLSENALNQIHKFIKAGRGYLSGHDTCYNKLLNNDMNITSFGGDYLNYIYGDTSVKINKKGLLTNYPWNICKIGDTLTIPMSHGGQLVSGDVWFKYTRNTWDINIAEVDSYNNIKGTNNFYLTTWNNTAMIQTGHSNGTATPDEQKILTNTLFYLAQVTEDTSWDDHKGQDLKTPTKPNITSVVKNSSNDELTISYDKSQDFGSSYDYYVEAKEKSTGDTVKSDVKSSVVSSGLKGYSILVDENKDSIPDNIVETIDTKYTLNNAINKDSYIHVAAVDNAGNVSEVSTYKYVYPTLYLTAEDLNSENNTVTIKAQATGTQSPIKKITLPDGSIVEGTNAEYTVDVNGTYIFKALDNEGNEVTKDITISNIPGNIALDDVKVNDDNASTTLNWSISDKTQDYLYNVNSKKSSETDYKSLPASSVPYIDENAKDADSPLKSDITSVVTDKNSNKTLIKFNESEDKGTSYDYYIDAKASTTGIESKSEIKSATVTSGLKGYSIVVDQNEDTVPDGTITTTSTEYAFDKVYDSDFYVHVAAVDNAGNISDVSTYKYAYPVLKLTPSTTEEVKDTVTITAEASCEGNSIEKVITPDGKEVIGNKAEYTVDVNGTYTFTAVDARGNEVPQSIVINNIKPDIILNVVPNMNKAHLEEVFYVDLTIDNIKDVFASEVKIKYDNSRLKFISFEQVDGTSFVSGSNKDGELTAALASFGVNQSMENKIILRMYFSGISAGDALIDVTNGTLGNGSYLEKKLIDAECGQTVVNICNRKLISVNPEDKEYTLLDLSIIAKHYGENPAELLTQGIDADLNLDGKIDVADYQKCYFLISQNPNHNF